MSPAFTAQILGRRLEALGAPAPAPLLCAVSGGADSLALAHMLHRLGRELRLVHVDHQLCAQSADWAAYVARLGQEWGVPVVTVRVQVEDDANIEARARAARYAAIAQVARPGEYLLTAHHLEDQAVTLLLQLLRGAGVAGLAAMPARGQRDTLVHLRPLLEVSASALTDYCRCHGLLPVIDPGNDDPRFDRNFLENDVAPILASRWPAFARTLARSATHCAEADALLLDLARLDTGDDLASTALDLNRLREAPPPRARNALRSWLRAQGLACPGTARLTEFVRQVTAAGSQTSPRLDLDGCILRAYQGVVYATQDDAPPADWHASLRPGSTLSLPGDAGTLSLVPGAPDTPPLRVALRQGGERFGQAPSRSLKTFLQHLHVLPWRRGQVPLVFADDKIVAVGDWWQSGQLAGRLTWQRPVPFRSSEVATLRNRAPRS